MQQQNSPKAIGGLACGVISIVLVIIGFVPYTLGIPGLIGLVVSIVGLVLSIMARKEMPTTMATAGLVTCIVGVCLCSIFGIGCTVCYCGTYCAGQAAVNSIYNALR